MARKKLVILTGAGISAESGIKTFRDSDGLWEEYHIEDVATPEAWERNPELVQEFYNERRRQLYKAEPNAGHRAIAEAERWIDVEVITQNVDNLHERAGSTHVLHLHGLLTQARSSRNPDLIYDIEGTEPPHRLVRRGGTQPRTRSSANPKGRLLRGGGVIAQCLPCRRANSLHQRGYPPIPRRP